MKLAKLLLYSATFALLLQSSCKSPTEPTTGNFRDTHVRGKVTRSDGLGGENGVTVRDLTLTAVSSVTDSSGNFDLLYSLDQSLVTKIAAFKSGFIDHANDTLSLTIDPGVDIPSVSMVLGVDSSSPPPGSSSTGIAASIILAASGSSNISVRGTGSNETTVLTFEVRDSLGFAISAANKVNVQFLILGGPGGGEYVFPNSADTDTKGRVTTRVNSGTTAGVLQIYATARNDSVSSSPIKITITNGLPDPGHFSISSDKSNVAGGPGLPNADNQKVTVSVLAGDRFGNPVQQGTAVYFTTTGGVIQANASTGSSGVATAELSTGNPRPVGGIAIVTARTIGDSGTNVSASLPVVFSGATRIIVPSTTFSIPDSGYINLRYQVQDQNGNPISGGSSIRVSVSGPGAGGLEIRDSSDVKIPDTRDTSFTNLSVTIVKNSRGGANGPVTVRIEVTSPNNATGEVEFAEIRGSVSTSGSGAGSGGGGGGPVSNPTADKMEVVAIARPSIIVNDGSNDDKSQTFITYLVKDSVGNPLTNAVNPSLAKVYVTFAVQGFSPQGFPVTGGESLLITADSTNEFSQVSTKLLAGTRSGIFKVTATVVGGPAYSASKTVSSIAEVIIKSGPPDAAHFGAAPNRFNFPGLDILSDGVTDQVVVAIGDKFGNPVEVGTRVYFDATHGFVAPEASSDPNGFLRVNLLAAFPKPEGANSIASLGGDGWGAVRARTIGDGGVELRDSVIILWTGKPIINVTSGPSTFTVINGGSAGPWTFTVLDRLGHPMSAGTTINVTAGDARVDGNANKTLPDANVGGSGITDFTFSLVDQDATDVDPPKATVLVINVSHPVYGTLSAVIATGTVD